MAITQIYPISILHDHLSTLSHYTLRGIAIRLQVRQGTQHRKGDWITAIITGWQQAPTRQQWLARLSSTAHSAVARLLAAEQIPAEDRRQKTEDRRQKTHNLEGQSPVSQSPVSQSLASPLLITPAVPAPTQSWF